MELIAKQTLARFPLLQDARPETIEMLARAARFVEWPAGHVLFHPGGRASDVYLLIDGLVALVATSEDGRELVAGLVPSCQPICTAALASNPHHVKSAAALVPSRAFLVPLSTVEKAIRQDGEVAFRWIQNLTDETLGVTRQYEMLAHQPVPYRVREALLRLAKALGTDDLPLTQAEIARVAGTTRETAAVVLGELREQGLVETRRGRIKLLNRAGLQSD